MMPGFGVQPVAPVYSHGGPGSTGFPTVPGTSVSNGQPISLIGAAQDACFTLVLSGTTGQTATVQIQANGGLVDATGNPPAGEWADVSNGGYAMTVGASNTPDIRKKIIPRLCPFYRTAIIAYTSGTLVSYCDGAIQTTGLLGTAQRPTLTSAPQVTNQ